MTSPVPSSTGGPYKLRDLRSLYPAVTENHLRYLEKWGLIRQPVGFISSKQNGAGGPSEGPEGSAAEPGPRARASGGGALRADGAGGPSEGPEGSAAEPGPRARASGGGALRASIDDRVYSFADLQVVKHVSAELQRGTPLKIILRSLAASRQGQLELDFHATPDTPRPKVLTLQARRPAPPAVGAPPPLPASASAFPFSDPQSALAAKYFLEGSRLDDGDERKMEQAAAAYRKALVIDPDLVPAIVNLANIHYAHDELIEAQALYERAIGLDPDCFEAHFNLGNIQHDLGRYREALASYRAAVALNPSYPDAHFYLAVTLEKTAQSAEAKVHWKAYKDLAPHGEWIELAKEFSE